MLRYMTKVRWQDRVTNEEVRERCGVEDLKDRMRRTRLRWFGHVKRREENNILKRVYDLDIGGRRPVGRPKKTWRKVVEEDMRTLNITEETVEDRQRWKTLITSNPSDGTIRTLNEDDDDSNAKNYNMPRPS